jgi:hypothetical protein
MLYSDIDQPVLNPLSKITKKEVPGVGLLTFVYMADPEGNILELQIWT